MSFLRSMLIAVAFVKSQLIVDIVYSSHTEPDFSLSLKALMGKKFQDEFEFNLVYVEDILGIENAISSPDILFDLTLNAPLSEEIKKLAETKHFIIGSISKQIDTYSNWEFFMHISWKNQIEALYTIISYLNWQTFVIISDQIHDENDDFVNYFFDKDYRWYYFSNSNDEISADFFIQKVIQPTGIKNIVILNRGESISLLLKGLEKAGILTIGSGVIVGSEGSWGLYGNGVISYTESGLEDANSYFSYEGLAIIKFLNQILSFTSVSDALDLLEFLLENTVNHCPILNFSLLNVQNNLKVISGSIINKELNILSPLSYPGNSLAIPNSPTTSINYWYANESFSFLTISTGEFYALEYWKTLHTLDGFQITATPCNCSPNNDYDPVYGAVCFSSLLTTPAVAFLTAFTPWTAISYIYTLRALNCSIPNVSPYAPSSISENKTTFPEFMTVVKDIRFNSQVVLDLSIVFNWKNFIVIYDDLNADTYSYFAALIERYNMNIVNKPGLRKMDTYYTRDKYPLWKDWFYEIISLKVRLFVIFLTPPYAFYMVESFYDAGMRQGNVILLSNNRLAYALALETDVAERKKLEVFVIGGLCVAQTEWIGDYGKMLKKGFIREYGNHTDFCCLSFDATMLLLNGIEFTINQGDNTNNSSELNNNLRKQKFLGCSGTVSIELDGNQRSFPTLGIYNLKWDDNSQLVYEDLVGQYDLGSAQLITLNKPIIWYDNTTIVPSDTIVYENGCPFPERKISHSSKGANVLYGISAALVVLTIIESFVVCKKFWKNIKIEKLSIAAYAYFEDYVLMGVIAADFFQFISQGPDISDLYVWLSKACSYSIIHFDSSITGDIYWYYLYISMIISCFWIFSAFILIFRLNKFDSWALKFSRKVALLLLPIIGHFLFLPMISVLLSFFQCNKGTGSNIDDSFIKHDCTTYCWNHKYALWGAFSLLSLITYIPLSIYFNKNYEDINDHINIKTNPLFIIEKTICQVVIVSINMTIKVYDEFLHGLCCIILFIVLILASFKQNCYNYSRMNLWLVISYLAILWNFILSTLYWLTKYESSILWRLLLYSVWITLIVTGIGIQLKWLPNLLLTDKGADIAIFFKFLMGNKISAEDINRIKQKIIENKYVYVQKALDPDYHEKISLSDININ